MSILTGKNLLLQEQILFYRSRPLFGMVLSEGKQTGRYNSYLPVKISWKRKQHGSVLLLLQKMKSSCCFQERKLEERRKRFKEDRDKFEDEQDVCSLLT